MSDWVVVIQRDISGVGKKWVVEPDEEFGLLTKEGETVRMGDPKAIMCDSATEAQAICDDLGWFWDYGP